MADMLTTTQSYLRALQTNPLRTKMITSGSLSAAQEVLATYLSGDISKDGSYITARVPKMAIYGAFISAPMGHVLINILQRVFAGQTSLQAKILQIVASNLIVRGPLAFILFIVLACPTTALLTRRAAQISPIQNTVYLISMAVIAGARTAHQIRATVRAGFLPIMKVSWTTSPLALVFAQKFLPQETWVPFFNLVSFILGTYINTITKRKRLAALRKKRDEER